MIKKAHLGVAATDIDWQPGQVENTQFSKACLCNDVTREHLLSGETHPDCGHPRAWEYRREVRRRSVSNSLPFSQSVPGHQGMNSFALPCSPQDDGLNPSKL